MHLTRYPERHAGLIHYSLTSYGFRYSGVYTSLVLTLGFKGHTTNELYLMASASKKKRHTSCILLINSNAAVWFGFFSRAYNKGRLKSILAGMTTSRILDTVYTHKRHLIGDAIRELADAELARRH